LRAAYVEALQDLVRPAGAADNERWEKAELALREGRKHTGDRSGAEQGRVPRMHQRSDQWFPELRRRFGPDVALCTCRDSCKMHDYREQPPTRYAVVYREEGGPSTAGRLVITGEGLLLDGGAGDRRCTLNVPFAELTEIHIGRTAAERLNGYSVLVLERRQAPSVHVAPFGVGLLHELADLIAVLTTEQRTGDEHVAVIVPLKAGCRQRVRELVAQGPPFNPAALGLKEHQVYLRERDVVFVFGGAHVRAKVERAMRNPTLWHAGLAWHHCIIGRPRLAAVTDTIPTKGEPLYSWTAESEQPVSA